MCTVLYRVHPPSLTLVKGEGVRLYKMTDKSPFVLTSSSHSHRARDHIPWPRPYPFQGITFHYGPVLALASFRRRLFIRPGRTLVTGSELARAVGRSWSTMDLAGWRLLAKLAIESGWRSVKRGGVSVWCERDF